MLDPSTLGRDGRLFVVAGPCVIEDASSLLSTAREIKRITDALGVALVFKASFDKANRSAVESFRGPGLYEGLKALEAVNRTRQDIEAHKEQQLRELESQPHFRIE